MIHGVNVEILKFVFKKFAKQGFLKITSFFLTKNFFHDLSYQNVKYITIVESAESLNS